MMQIGKKNLTLPALFALTFLALTACGGGGGSGGPPKVQSVSDSQLANVLINISAGYGPSSWVLLQYDPDSQLYNVFINRAQLPAPLAGAKPDLQAVTADPNNWEPYARNTVTVLGTTAALTLDNGSSANAFTTTSQAVSDFVTGNPNLVQSAWSEIREK